MEYQVVPPGGDKNNAPARKAVSGLFLFISVALPSLRIYVRARMVKKLWWDDFFLLLGLLFNIPVFGLSIASMNSGSGRHAYYLSPEQILFSVKLQKIGLPFAIICVLFVKIFICLFLLRNFMTNRVWKNRVWKRAMYIIMALIVATGLSSAIAIFLQCKPVAKSWNPKIKGTCWSKGTTLAMFYYQGCVSIFTDFLLAFLPIYFLKDLQISIRTKLSICFLMSLGVIAGICAINRIVLTAQLYSSDVTYSEKNLHIWSSLEMGFAIIVAAIPALRPLWAKSANQNQKNGGQVHWPNNKRHLNSTYAMMDQQREVDSLPTRLETRIAAQGGQNQGDVGSEATPLPDCNVIMKTSHVK